MVDERTRPAGHAVDEHVVVRRATADDDPFALRRLRLEMLEDTPVAFIERLADVARRSPAYWQDRLRRYTADPDRVLVIAESGGVWLAQGGGYADPSGVAHFVSVYVTPRLRGTGMVERLADGVSAWARERGCLELRLEVAEVNARALAAYRRLGFRPTGHHQPHPLYPEEGDEIEMALEL